MNMMIVEYPQYGIYNKAGVLPSAKNILEDAYHLMQFITRIMKISQENIILMGRSIGTGPVVEMASIFKPACLLLVSPFTSIKDIATDQLGYCAGLLIRQRFNNLELIKSNKIQCPILFIHGQRDQLVPVTQSQILYKNYKGHCSMILPTQMTHNEFDFTDDFIMPIYMFLLSIGQIDTNQQKLTGWSQREFNILQVIQEVPKWLKQLNDKKGQRRQRICYCLCKARGGGNIFQSLIRKLLF
eukprot:403342275